MIYFITQTDEYVKIGYTTDNPEARLTAIQVGNPKQLTLALVISGGQTKEEALHIRFAPYSIRGEWFYLSHEIKGFIREAVLNQKDIRTQTEKQVLDDNKRVIAILGR